jgi:UDP-N-acetyl-D-glucosamine/UDP-N-acetyl-D-galactosamine dehydrogenase
MIKKSEISIAVIGLGYVGLPLSVEFSKKFPVVGYDSNTDRIKELKRGKDRTREIDSSELNKNESLLLSDSHSCLKGSNVYIVTVPTPVDKNKTPNLDPLKSASKTIGKYVNKGDVVIYESTVYPGATEEICVPILEKESGLIYNSDFFCGYSPERINPGDKDKSLSNIKKITSGSNKNTAKFVKSLYQRIIKAGVFPASSIKVAEAAKVIENTQRDVNIALINELALIFNKLNIDTTEVLEAAGTKWNFLPFKPGLVGGHCIGVDPYYLTHKAVEIGYKPEIITAGRRINDSMGKYVAEQAILRLIKNNINPAEANIAILGITFKENCPDLRNSKVINILDHLAKYKCKITVSDEIAHAEESLKNFGIKLTPFKEIQKMDAVIFSVAHKEYLNLKISDFQKLLNKKGLVIDVKSIFGLKYFSESSIIHWRL